MTPQQLHNLETYTLRIQQRQRIAKAVIKALFVFFVTCVVFACWASLVGCSLMQPIRYLDDLGDTSGDPVWPAQGCGIPKLSEPEPFDPSKFEVKSESKPFDPAGYTGTIKLESSGNWWNNGNPVPGFVQDN